MHFHLNWLEAIQHLRTPLFTKFFLGCSFIGDVNGYILIVTLIYVMWDKRLALRLAALVLTTGVLNHFLKIIIRNPRPFVAQGTYLNHWAVPKSDATSLAKEFSTPSGHAMAAGAFYPYLYKFANSKIVKVICVLAPLLIGMSRPYLGVHYVEDVLIGWAVGLAISLLTMQYADSAVETWTGFTHTQRIVVVATASIVISLISLSINSWRVDPQQKSFASYLGFLAGVLVSYPLELKLINFDPKSSPFGVKALRYAVSVSLVIGTLYLLHKTFEGSGTLTKASFILEFIRYAAAGAVSMLAAPMIFTAVGLAEKHQQAVKSK